MTKQQMKVVAQAEHEMFCLRDLLEGSVPAKVMNRAYEYVIKQDLLSVYGKRRLPISSFLFDAAAQAAGFPLSPVAENRIFAHRRAAQCCASRDAAHLSQAPDRGVPKRASDGMNLFVGDDVTQWVIRKALYTSSRRNRLGRS